MSNASNEIKRIEFIDKLLSNGGHYSPEEIAEELEMFMKEGGTSVKTVYRVLKKMKEDFHAPIGVDEQKKRYYVSEGSVILPSYVARSENFRFVEIVRNLLESIKNTPVYEEAFKLFNELSRVSKDGNNVEIAYGKDFTAAFNDYGDTKTKDILTSESVFQESVLSGNKTKANSATSRVIFLGAPAADVKNNIWDTVFKAMEKNYHLVIEYESSGNEIIKRGIRPYQLIFDDGIWDLWGYDCVNKENRQYNLCRIKNVEIRKEVFKLPEDYDYRNVTPGTFGCYRDTDSKSMTKYSIYFKKGSYAERFAKDRVWGRKPSIKEDETGTVISFENNQFLPVLRWVLGWGASVKPLEPEKLVNAWKKEIKNMAGQL